MTTKTDRELLELAASAAEADYEVDGQSGEIEILSEIGGFSGTWNPLTDDGDAFRLAVKLGLLVDSNDEGEANAVALGVCDCQPHGSDPYAATRRAIVRAAAAIGAKS